MLVWSMTLGHSEKEVSIPKYHREYAMSDSLKKLGLKQDICAELSKATMKSKLDATWDLLLLLKSDGTLMWK